MNNLRNLYFKSMSVISSMAYSTGLVIFIKIQKTLKIKDKMILWITCSCRPAAQSHVTT